VHDAKGGKLGDIFSDVQTEHVGSFLADPLHILRRRADVFTRYVEATEPLDEASQRAQEGFILLMRGIRAHHTFAAEIHVDKGRFIGHAACEPQDVVNRLVLRRVRLHAYAAGSRPQRRIVNGDDRLEAEGALLTEHELLIVVGVHDLENRTGHGRHLFL
jgi:hypothetical protein